MEHLFTPYAYKGLHLKNRIVMPPMCQYSVTKEDGVATDWHFQHYVSRAVGGTGLIIVEMTNVEPDGRISNRCLGLWNETQRDALKKIVDAVHAHGSKIAIQIAHAGRKAENAEVPVSASDVQFDEHYRKPRSLSTDEVKLMVKKYQQSVKYAVEAGFDAIEIHGAHGYLIHQFHSPLTNKRADEYAELTRFGTEVIQAAKAVMPEDMPLIFRISAKEYVDGGYDVDTAIALCKAYEKAGAEIFHISSGGEGPIGSRGKPGTHAGYQVPLARAVKHALKVPVIAVGRLDDAQLANATIGNEDADMVAVGRGMLRNPYWALEANATLNKINQQELVPKQYFAGF
ncbi:NADH:flavin oxidoreductase/NADH oxidase [Macrococcus sp. DPC7161]|uniref:NADH:flavin oxidoreductase/NADH oxidase n=1 Tax=Macrococcus sp. DPC7161 TaxID=2507060 RepID=UPI00100A5048|nr:NADH:flavin oxidoreductase/NADH oxidase [Macrococcus sp. DPC7161]RXK18423.1 NADH:flavin oxidoreductase/NADH oxidase [Macrococcus sp. DPC7161]